MKYNQSHKHILPLAFGEGSGVRLPSTLLPLGGGCEGVGLRAVLLIALLICSVSLQAQTLFPYKVKGTVPDDSFDGKTLYMMRYDNHSMMDSTTVHGREFVFEGQTDKSYLCRIDAGRDYTNFVLDQGTVTVDFDTHLGSGTELNRNLTESEGQIQALINDYFSYYRKKLTEEGIAEDEQQSLLSEYYDRQIRPNAAAIIKKNVVENRDNGVALAMLIGWRDMLLPDEMDILRTQFGEWLPTLEAVKEIMKAHDARKKTAEGMPFVDLKGEGLDGNEMHLSDFVGKGRYVLADMWASWCGPCKAETPNLAELYNAYKDKGLVVLGIGTWDKPENIKKAVADLNIPWPQLIDTGNAAMEKYGVEGIPHIILFAPDGTIVARNLRGNEMKAKVKKVMEN